MLQLSDFHNSHLNSSETRLFLMFIVLTIFINFSIDWSLLKQCASGLYVTD